MARLWYSGNELNSTTSGGEVNGTGSSIVTTTVRTGLYAWRQNYSAQAGLSSYQFKSADTADGFYFRFYFRMTDGTGTTNQIFSVSAGGGLRKVSIRLTSTNTLQLYNQEDGAQTGSDSAALSLNIWYLIEVKVDCTTLATTSVEARIDGVSFASGTINLAAGVSFIQWGLLNNNETADFQFEEFVINDDSGSSQNSWPGAGAIVHLSPNAAGDNNQLGGAAATNYQNVDEVTPDDATTTITTVSDATGEIDDYNIESATDKGVHGTISVVSVGARFAGGGASNNDSAVLRIKASASGTVEESGNLTPSNASYVANAAAAPRNYPLVLYDLPGASTTAWTATDLDSAQIGLRKSADSTNGFVLSTIWAAVDYVPTHTGINFNGNNAYVTYASNAAIDFTNTGSYTFMCWFKHGINTNATQVFFKKAAVGTSGYKIFYDGTNKYFKIEEQSAGFTSTRTANNSVTVADGTMHHFAMSYNGNTQTIVFYLDGSSIANAANLTWANVASNTTSPLTIGGDGGANTAYGGVLDGVLIYNTDLSGATISNIYSTKTYPTTNLIFNADFDEGTGTTATDEQSSLVGTLTNGPSWVPGIAAMTAEAAATARRQQTLMLLGVG